MRLSELKKVFLFSFLHVWPEKQKKESGESGFEQK